ncbi:hypothetical protein Syun_031532 [Stephania yunnanensis]|uniref:Uncharacterized protein n=1 Tax=Stephania yunnanensis TaxID=152371 RepID=A0AAP0DZP5_9MAGN
MCEISMKFVARLSLLDDMESSRFFSNNIKSFMIAADLAERKAMNQEFHEHGPEMVGASSLLEMFYDTSLKPMIREERYTCLAKVELRNTSEVPTARFYTQFPIRIIEKKQECIACAILEWIREPEQWFSEDLRCHGWLKHDEGPLTPPFSPPLAKECDLSVPYLFGGLTAMMIDGTVTMHVVDSCLLTLEAVGKTESWASINSIPGSSLVLEALRRLPTRGCENQQQEYQQSLHYQPTEQVKAPTNPTLYTFISFLSEVERSEVEP